MALSVANVKLIARITRGRNQSYVAYQLPFIAATLPSPLIPPFFTSLIAACGIVVPPLFPLHGPVARSICHAVRCGSARCSPVGAPDSRRRAPWSCAPPVSRARVSLRGLFAMRSRGGRARCPHRAAVPRGRAHRPCPVPVSHCGRARCSPVGAPGPRPHAHCAPRLPARAAVPHRPWWLATAVRGFALWRVPTARSPTNHYPRAFVAGPDAIHFSNPRHPSVTST